MGGKCLLLCHAILFLLVPGSADWTIARPVQAGWSLLNGSASCASVPPAPVYGGVGKRGASWPGGGYLKGASCRLQGGMAIFGGSRIPQPHVPSNELWLFDHVSSTWTWLSGGPGASDPIFVGPDARPPPIGTAGMAPDASGDTLYVFGGYWFPPSAAAPEPQNSVPSDMFWAFNATSLSWRLLSGSPSDITDCFSTYGSLRVESGGRPGCRDAPTFVADNAGGLVLWGGNGVAASTANGYLNDAWRYDLKTANWTWIAGSTVVGQMGVFGERLVPGSGFPGARCYHAAVVLRGNGAGGSRGRMVIAGGLTQTNALDASLFLDDVWLFDLDTYQYTWISGSSSVDVAGSYAAGGQPGARMKHVLGEIGGRVVLYGGFGYGSDLAIAPQFLGDVWLLNVTIGEWCLACGDATDFSNLMVCAETDSQWPLGRVFAFSASINDSLVVYGGQSAAYLADVWQFSAPAGDTECGFVTASCGLFSKTTGGSTSARASAWWIGSIALAAEAVLSLALLAFTMSDPKWRIRFLPSAPSFDPRRLISRLGSGLAVTWEIPPDALKIGERLGSGEHGIVFKAMYHETECVVKVATRADAESRLRFLKECARMQSMRPHPHVVQVYGVCAEPDLPLMLVMEYMNAGSLLHLILQPMVHIDARFAMSVLRDVASGMQHIHASGFLQADLAARNVLLTRDDERLVAKVSDFGLSRTIGTTNAYGIDLPVRWMAPEALLDGTLLSPLSDVYAFGVLTYEVLQRGLPFEGMNALEVYDAVVHQGVRLPRPRTVPHPDALFRLMVRCTEHDRDERPQFSEIYKDLSEMLHAIENESQYSSDVLRAERTYTSAGLLVVTGDVTGGQDGKFLRLYGSAAQYNDSRELAAFPDGSLGPAAAVGPPHHVYED